jgi:hypothetical protein
MADYFPLLSRTIASLGNSTAEQRQVVYQRARVVVQDQLAAIDPPMAEEAIEQELELFEHCVVRLEKEMQSLESLKGEEDDATKENSTRRHISARLSDLMAKAAAARTAATQERLKADLPMSADPALSRPAVRVEAVPVLTPEFADRGRFSDQEAHEVDYPLVNSSVIEGDPLDALTEAHVRKLAQVKTDQVKTDAEDVDSSRPALDALTSAVEKFDEPSVEATSEPEDQAGTSVSLSSAIETRAPSIELSSGLIVDPETREVRGRPAALPGDNFSQIPWLVFDPAIASIKDPGDYSDQISSPDFSSSLESAISAVEVQQPEQTVSDLPDLLKEAVEEGVPHTETSVEDKFASPEMPQVKSAVVSALGPTSTAWPAWPSVADFTAEDQPASEQSDETHEPYPAYDLAKTDLDAEAAKAAFWGEAYQSKKDGSAQDEPLNQEAAAEIDHAEETAPTNLLEFTEDESRPRLLQKRRLDRDVVRKLVMVSVFATVTAAVGITAWILRDQPSDFEQNTGLERSDLSRKINDRLPSDSGPQTEAAKALPQIGQAGGQRAILLEEIPDGQAPPPPVIGQVAWSLDTIREANGAADVAVKVEVKGLSGSLTAMAMTLKRNRDLSFPASHLLEVSFVTPEASVNGRVRDIGLPEMRIDETTRGAALFGLPVPVTDNVFLVGLTNLPDRIEFNIDLLRSRKWIVIPVRFANGRRAALMVEKGLGGDRALLDAFQAWK